MGAHTGYNLTCPGANGALHSPERMRTAFVITPSSVLVRRTSYVHEIYTALSFRERGYDSLSYGAREYVVYIIVGPRGRCWMAPVHSIPRPPPPRPPGAPIPSPPHAHTRTVGLTLPLIARPAGVQLQTGRQAGRQADKQHQRRTRAMGTTAKVLAMTIGVALGGGVGFFWLEDRLLRNKVGSMATEQAKQVA